VEELKKAHAALGAAIENALVDTEVDSVGHRDEKDADPVVVSKTDVPKVRIFTPVLKSVDQEAVSIWLAEGQRESNGDLCFTSTSFYHPNRDGESKAKCRNLKMFKDCPHQCIKTAHAQPDGSFLYSVSVSPHVHESG